MKTDLASSKTITCVKHILLSVADTILCFLYSTDKKIMLFSQLSADSESFNLVTL